MRSIITAVLLLAGTSASAAPYSSVNGWEMSIEDDGTCSMTGSLLGGILLAFSIIPHHDQVISIRAGNRSWSSLNPGMTYSLSVKFGKLEQTVYALAVNHNGMYILGMELPREAFMYSVFKRERLTISYGDNKILDTVMDGGANAGPALARCARAAGDPFAR